MKQKKSTNRLFINIDTLLKYRCEKILDIICAKMCANSIDIYPSEPMFQFDVLFTFAPKVYISLLNNFDFLSLKFRKFRKVSNNYNFNMPSFLYNNLILSIQIFLGNYQIFKNVNASIMNSGTKICIFLNHGQLSCRIYILTLQ